VSGRKDSQPTWGNVEDRKSENLNENNVCCGVAVETPQSATPPSIPTSVDQFAAIGAVAGLLRPGGAYLAIENFVDGNDRLNELRSLYGLPPIEIRWHNRFFREAEFAACARQHFRTLETVDFSSSYYFATRVIYSALCAVDGTSPDYRHLIHERSTKLPPFGDFSPIKLFVLGK
jgi:hypothetical protein